MNQKITLFFVAAAVLVLGILAVGAKSHAYFPIDLMTTRFLQQFSYTPFHTLMVLVSDFGTGWFKYAVLVIVSIFIVLKKKKQEGIVLILSTLGADAIGDILKSVVSRHRPDPLLVTQVSHFTKPDSFPSGHVIFYVGFFGFLLYLVYKFISVKSVKYLSIFACLFFIVLVGPSRIYLGAHWMSDVLGAYLAGFIWLSFSIFLYKTWKNEK